MRPRFLTALIICVTLMAQLVAPISAAGPMARMSSAVDAVQCEMHAHHAGAATDATQPPAGDEGKHDHASCVFCQLGASAPPGHEPAPVARLETLARRIVVVFASRTIATFYFNRNAPARAPPSLV